MIKLLVLVLIAILLALVATVTLRALTYGRSQPEVERTELLAIDAEHAARLLSEAVAIPTISYSVDAEPERTALLMFHDYLRREFPHVHQVMQIETIDDLSLLYTWRGTTDERKPILFSAHMDVVPVEPGTEDLWEHPPFAGEIADGYIWGRGTLDMKNSLVGYMIAAEELIASGFSPDRTIYFAFSHDEELGSQAAKKIASTLTERGIELEFTLDEGLVVTNGMVPGIKQPVALIGTAEKGLISVEISGRGAGGHASVPPNDSLNERLARALAAIMDAPFDAELVTPAEQLFEYIGPEFPFTNRLVLGNRWLFEPLILRQLAASPPTNALIRTTVAPTIMESGFKANALPEEGRIVLNIRIQPGLTVDAVVARISEIVAGYCDSVRASGPTDLAGECLTVRAIGNEGSDPSAVSDASSQSFRQIRIALHQVFPDVLSAPGLLVGRTDSRRYADIAEQSYRFLPSRLTSEDLERIHGTDERISVNNFVEIIQFYVQVIRLAASDAARGVIGSGGDG